MSAQELHANAKLMSDSERLLATLQAGFQGLMRKQEDQMRSQKEHAEKLQKAIEALKTQVPPTPDKTTTFWASYMKLANEYDKDIKEKYDTDLDTALIFAGLFSAVSSAFIIQIQPQLIPTSGQPQRIIVLVQSLLYISLFTTLLAALLAVLGKQWIKLYGAAGSRGTLSERGLERQQKLDGLHIWKFDAVLQTFPLLLQLSLFLFTTALSVYLWTVNRTIAIIVQALTSLGFIAYILLLVSAMLSPVSPFQTPVAHFLRPLISPLCRLPPHIAKVMKFLNKCWTSWSSSLKSGAILPCLAPHVLTPSPATSSSLDLYCHLDVSPPSPEVPVVLWVLEISTDPQLIAVAAEIAVDLQWPLDLVLTAPMARLASSFNACFDQHVWPPSIRDGMAPRAISYGRAYCLLRHIARVSTNAPPIPDVCPCAANHIRKTDNDDPVQFSHLLNVLRMIEEDLVLDWEDPLTTRLVLHTSSWDNQYWEVGISQGPLEHFLDQCLGGRMTNIDKSIFANYLFRVTCFLAPPTPGMIGQVDKIDFEPILLEKLFHTLQAAPLEDGVVARIVNATAQLANNLPERNTLNGSTVLEVIQFCENFHGLGGSADVLVSAATLVNLVDLETFVLDWRAGDPFYIVQDVDWIYVAMAHVQRLWEEKMAGAQLNQWDTNTILAVGSLLQLLANSTAPSSPPLPAFNVILQALSSSGDISSTAFLILYRAQTWFLDADLKPRMLQWNVWAHLGRVSLQFASRINLTDLYIQIGENIADTAGWKLSMRQELPTWIEAYSTADEWSQKQHLTAKFSSVIRKIWLPEFDKLSDEDEESWVLALSALSHVWWEIRFTDGPDWQRFVQLTRCTISASLQTRYVWGKSIAITTRTTFSSPLGTALTQAAADARWALSGPTEHSMENPLPFYPLVETRTDEETQALGRVADFLEALGQKIGTEFEQKSGQILLGGSLKRYNDWKELKKYFMAELDSLERVLVE
ncbi:hypothetical protein MVEN_02181200 [Mycena venus]|uniref:DUF6535 domain-containing protein n=1 Tax=Mycena venus TaxID=2733690 RepID=A0A8H7CI75_9AGAR|nr:hypothetical protein MVEN_02181200 [Mycena venus]